MTAQPRSLITPVSIALSGRPVLQNVAQETAESICAGDDTTFIAPNQDDVIFDKVVPRVAFEIQPIDGLRQGGLSIVDDNGAVTEVVGITSFPVKERMTQKPIRVEHHVRVLALVSGSRD